jgi:hypothetical protein
MLFKVKFVNIYLSDIHTYACTVRPACRVPKNGKLSQFSESCRELIFDRNVMNVGGSDKLTLLTNSIDTHFGTESPTDRDHRPSKNQLPTFFPNGEVANFPHAEHVFRTLIGLRSMRARACH